VRSVEINPLANADTLTQTGEVQARRETDLSFLIEGRVARRFVEVGAKVSKGDVIAVLDTGIVRNEVRAAEAELASASSALELATSTRARVQQLYTVQSVAQQQMDEASTNLRVATARRDAAVVAVDMARKKLSYAQLLAEETGTVVAVGANQGQVVAPGLMIARVATQELDAVFSVSEHVINEANADVKVRVSLASNPAVSVTGTVREVSPAADPVTRTYRVRIALPNPPKEVTIGATVIGKVEIPTSAVVAIPSSAMTSEDGQPAVYVFDPRSSKLLRRRVTVSRYENDRVFIAAGLGSGERVVTAGVSKLRPGQTVTLEAGVEVKP
jgi:RND family efflux transporter MFP subunit